MKYFHFCGYNLLSAGAETPVFSGVMRCKPDVASPTGCRAASCRFLSFSVVFLPFRPAFPAVRSSCLLRRPLLPSSPPTAPPVFSAVRSCLLRRPLFPFSARPPAPAHYILLCALPGTAPFRVLSFASPAPLPSRASSLPRLFPPAPLPSRASSLPRLFPLVPLPSRASSLPRLARAPSAPRFRLLATYFSVIGLTESEIFP